MAADVTSGCTLTGHTIGMGMGFAIVTTAATADDTDYFDMDTLLGTSVNVIWAKGVQDGLGTPADEPMGWTGSTTTPDRVTIGGSTDNKARQVLVCYLARSSTGGD